MDEYVHEVYIVSADGKEEYRLIPQNPVWKMAAPSGWTPDSRAIIVSLIERKPAGQSRQELWLYYLKENQFEQLTYSSSTDIQVLGAVWGPNGKVVMTVYEPLFYPNEIQLSLWTIDAPY